MPDYPRCFTCGHMLGHIDDACPVCLPNFRANRLAQEPANHARFWRDMAASYRRAGREQAALNAENNARKWESPDHWFKLAVNICRPR